MMDRDREQLERIKRWGQIALAVAAVALIWWVTQMAGGGMIDDGMEAGRHKIDMLIFTLSGIGCVLLTIWILTLPVVRHFLHMDVLLDVERRWRAGEKLTETDLSLARSFAINSGLRIAGVLLAVSEIATPLG